MGVLCDASPLGAPLCASSPCSFLAAPERASASAGAQASLLSTAVSSVCVCASVTREHPRGLYIEIPICYQYLSLYQKPHLHSSCSSAASGSSPGAPPSLAASSLSESCGLSLFVDRTKPITWFSSSSSSYLASSWASSSSTSFGSNYSSSPPSHISIISSSPPSPATPASSSPAASSASSESSICSLEASARSRC